MYRGSLNGGLLLNLAEAEEEAGPVVGIVDDIRECSEIICTIMTFQNKIFAFGEIFVFNCIYFFATNMSLVDHINSFICIKNSKI